MFSLDLLKQMTLQEYQEWQSCNSDTMICTPLGVLGGADHDPGSLPGMENFVQQKHFGSKFRFVYRRDIKRITLQRALVSLLYHFPGKITLLDFLVIYENMLWCNAKSQSDPNFNKKFGKALEVLTKILKKHRVGLKVSGIRKLHSLLLEADLSGFLLEKRNIGNVLQQLRNSVYLVDGEIGKLKMFLPPKSFIGKGYGDHGCLRNTAWDGSPHWTEVAMAHLEILEDQNEL